MTSRAKIDFDAINALALGRFESLLWQWLPSGKRSGAEYTAINPMRSDGHAGSFTINTDKGVWKDFASGDGGGDPVSLYAYLFHHNDQGAAARELADSLGLSAAPSPVSPANVKPSKTGSRSDWQPIIPSLNAPPPHKAHIKRGFPEQIWCYHSASGPPLGYVYRFLTSDGGKVTLPLSWCLNKKTGVEEWRWMAFVVPRWLYGLDRLTAKPDAPVLILEGEKCADAAMLELPAFACMTWPGGAKAVAKADWRPLAGRDVVIWPDCDSLKNQAGAYLPYLEQSGMKAALAIADICLALSCRVWLLDVAQPGEKISGWDVADAIAEGLHGQDLHDYIKANARIYTPLEQPEPFDSGSPEQSRRAHGKPQTISRQTFEAELTAAGADIDAVLRICSSLQLSALHAAEVELLLKQAANAIGVSTYSLRNKKRMHDPAGGGGVGNNGQPPADASSGSYPQREEWERGLIEKPRGGLEDCRENVFLILSRHPEWQAIIGWNEFTRRVEKTKPTPFGSLVGEWKIGDDYETGLWLAQHCNLLLRSEATIIAGVAMCADKNKFHPPRDWLESLPVWDGVDRLEHFIADCVGCEKSQYIQLIGKYFMIGIIARIYRPGCPMQYMPILEGAQGMGKSSMWRALGGDWFQDTPLKLGDKDAYMQLTGTLVYEIAELDAFNKAESTMVKGFITQENDRFREPYGRRPIDNPRQCVFVGTTNHGEYLKDTTGNRRMWPIKAVDINLDLIKALRPLLFAEALYRFNAGERWHPSREEEREHFMPEQDDRRIVDPWLYPLQDWLNDIDQLLTNEFTVTDLLLGALKVELNKIDGNRSMATRIGNMMAEIGWDRKRRLRNRRTETVYMRPDVEQIGN